MVLQSGNMLASILKVEICRFYRLKIGKKVKNPSRSSRLGKRRMGNDS